MAGGRPTKYDPDLGHRIAQHVRYGATVEHAAAAEGVSHDSIERWTRRYPEFCDEIMRAKADPITQNLRVMNVAAQRGSVAAAIWLLEHLAPERYGKAATELPALLSLLLQKLPPEIAGQVVVAWGILPDTPYHARGLTRDQCATVRKYLRRDYPAALNRGQAIVTEQHAARAEERGADPVTPWRAASPGSRPIARSSATAVAVCAACTSRPGRPRRRRERGSGHARTAAYRG